MKKLMIAVAIVCATAFAQAATISWDCTAGWVTDPEGINISDVTTYLIYSGTIDQDTLVTGWTEGYESTVAGYAADTTTITEGQFSVVESTPAEAFGLPTVDDGVYFVLFDGDTMYVSEEEFFGYDDQSHTYFAYFDGQYDAFMEYDSKDGYVGQGWYSTTVPEPTTGLLMLLGMAGLALRRRRA